MQEQCSTPEEWRAVVGYEGKYEVSNMGRVRSFFGKSGTARPAPHIMTAANIPGKYSLVCLCKNGVQGSPAVHKLVLEAFVGLRLPGMECAHWNRNKHDNRLSNLRWATPKENAADRLRHGTDYSGEGNPRAVLTDSDVCAMRRRYEVNGETTREIAKDYGVTKSQVYKITRRRVWKHVA